MASRLGLLRAALLATFAFSGSFARMGEAKPPSDEAVRKLVEAAMEASETGCGAALAAREPFDALTWVEAAAWRKPLLTLAGKGRKAPVGARNYLYDKPERGLYLLGGTKGGKGGLPRKRVVSARDVANAPQCSVGVTKWNLKPTFTEQTFSFSPPNGAKKVDFVPLAKR